MAASLRLPRRPVDFRVASHPTSYGENLVLRILDRLKGLVQINQIGLDEAALNTLKAIIAKPEGIVLVTGPTGSGKTTTLYSILNHVNTESVNIMTLEDPVEYPIPLIRQSSVNEAAKLDFVSGIRSLMRQGPDIILVGEIRDHPTAEMAFRAAVTGHQVYSTLTPTRPSAPFRACWISASAGHHGGQHHRYSRPASGAHTLPSLQISVPPGSYRMQNARRAP